jgi:hypothetical protein
VVVKYGSLPFREQVDFFRQKINLPTQSWTDLWEGMHSRAFVVAGAMREDLLTDFRAAVDKAIAEGTTLREFRKDFDAIVEKHGWSYNGGAGWRSRVIYETNLRMSHAAGREAQMADPELRKRRPFGLYRHGGSEDPRPEHLALDGLVLPLDDPFWEQWTPPNGWGCKCKKFMVSQADVDRLGLTVADKAPDIPTETRTVGVNGPSPRTVTVPKGIDPGFAYNPGTAAQGRRLPEEVMEGWRKRKADAWEQLSVGGWQAYQRPGVIPLDVPKVALGLSVVGEERLRVTLGRILGGEEKVFRPGGVPVNVNAAVLARHVDSGRSIYLPLLIETLEQPFEVWATFERHKGTGKVELRTRVLKAFDLKGKAKGMLVVAQARKGQMEGWTVIPSPPGYLEGQRKGRLLYGR